MTDLPDSLEPLPPSVTAFRARRWPVAAAWLVILGCVSLSVDRQQQRPARAEPKAGPTRETVLLLEVQARALVTAVEQDPAQRSDAVKKAEALDTGGFGERVRMAILLGDLDGPARALQQLQRVQHWVKEQQLSLNATQQQALPVLTRLYDDYQAGRWDAPHVSESEREFLRTRLGWFGELALAPPQGPDAAARAALLRSAQNTTFTLTAAVFAFVVATSVGGVALLTLLMTWVQGRQRPFFTTGSPAGGIYAETFAVWMVLFIGLLAGASLLNVGVWWPGLSGAAMLLSLTALAWPRWRGLSWGQVRREIGWTAGPRPRMEPMIGISCYFMALPLLVVGLLGTGALLYLQQHLREAQTGGGPGGMPQLSHPIAEAVVQVDWWVRIQLLILASVIAPIVEETMFRGVLYRHLREASARWGRLGSAFLSATAVSFVFAVVHPQGVLAVPALMGLAYGLNLGREWRDTLIPSMVAHGINNGVVFTLLLFLAGS